MPGFKARPAIDRFIEKFEIDHATGCWNWAGTCARGGYGMFMLYRRGRAEVKYMSAHRHSYHFFVEPIAEGMHIDHLCRNPKCVNPDHLEPVTPEENMRRGLLGVLKPPFFGCGHPRTIENSYFTKKGKYQECRTCVKARTARAREAKKAAVA